jgi:hypothetical protein
VSYELRPARLSGAMCVAFGRFIVIILLLTSEFAASILLPSDRDFVRSADFYRHCGTALN